MNTASERRELVSRFLVGKNLNPLIFVDHHGESAKLGIKKRIRENETSDAELIKIILMHKEDYFSKDRETGTVETSPGKHRSVLDIWRHVIFYRKLSIFDVMSILYSIREDLRIQYCRVIHRRVFDSRRDSSGFLRSDLQMDFSYLDEFGLDFMSWENINSEEE